MTLYSPASFLAAILKQHIHFPRQYPVLRSVVLKLCIVAALLGGGGSIILLSTNRVSFFSGSAFPNSWEPSSSAGSTWITGWTQLNNRAEASVSYVSAWNGTSWNSPIQLTAPNGLPTGDVYLEWDATRSRHVFTVLDQGGFGANFNIWYGNSSDSSGTSWSFRSTPVFSAGPGIGWDFPSVGVDSSGRIIVGALQSPGDSRFHTAVSTDGGITFTSSSPVPTNPDSNTFKGPRSRVVAAGATFYAFIPVIDFLFPFLPRAVELWQSNNGVNWSFARTLMTFGPPLNSSPSTYCGSQGCFSIFYAPLLDARGSSTGQWTVSFQINNGGYNNVFICTSDRGCGLVNAAAADQFMAGNSVALRSGTSNHDYWVSYLTNSTLGTRAIPLITQAIYFPPGAAAIGATTNTNIDPTTWVVHRSRCTTSCYASGDYAGITSNPFAAASTPFVQQASPKNDLFQSFVQDPPAEPNIQNFTPNFVPFPVGADLTNLALPVPPQSGALHPNQTRGVLAPSGQ